VRTFAAFTPALIIALATPYASAQTPAEQYEEGLAAMLAGDFAKGCGKLEQSYQAEPLAGALFTVAACYARWGKVKTALAHYESFLQLQAKEDLAALPEDKRKTAEDRMKNALAQVSELKAQIPRLTVSLSAPVGGAQATVDGAAAPFDTPILLDPGDHTVIVVGPDDARREQVETLGKGDVRTVTLDLPRPSEAPVAPPVVQDEGDIRDAMIIGAIVAGGVGVAGIVVGSITGAMVFGKKGDVDDNCNGNVCNQDGKDAADSAQTLGLVSTIGFGVGAAGLALGAVLFFLAPDEVEGDGVGLSPARVRLDIASEGAWFGLRGHF
jgi:hypothetical protein